MDLPIKLRHLPGRIVTGAFILNSGLNKRHADDGTVAGCCAMPAGRCARPPGAEPDDSAAPSMSWPRR
jgi:hypothetical protein